MMGAKLAWHLGTVASSLLALSALSACTVGPRVPIYDPAERESSTRDDAARPDSDDDFKIPEAESVGAEAPPTEPPQRPRATDGLEFTTIGLANVAIGPRPPWSKLESLESAVPAPDNAPARWSMQKSIWVGQGYLHHATFVPGGQSVVTLSNESGSIYHYDLAGKRLNEIALSGFREFDDAAIASLDELSSRPQIFIARPEGTTVLDLESGKIDELTDAPEGTDLKHAGRPGLYGVTLRKTSPQSGTLTLQWLSGEIALRAECHHRPDGWALSPDGRYLAIAYYPADQVEVIDLIERKLVSTLKTPKWGSAIAISPNGKWIALGGSRLQVATFPDGHLVAEDTAYDNNIDTVRFTPQGDLLLTSAYDGKARSYVFPENLKETKALPKPQLLSHNGTANVYALGLTPDGRMLVTSSGDETLKIWKR